MDVTSPPGFARHRFGLAGVVKHGWGRDGWVRVPGGGGPGRSGGRRPGCAGSGGAPHPAARSVRPPGAGRGGPAGRPGRRRRPGCRGCGRLPQPLVALVAGGARDPGQLDGEHRPRIPRSWAVAHRQGHARGGRPVELALQPLQQCCWHLGRRGGQVAAGNPLVAVARGVAAGWSDDIPATAAPVHLLEAAGAGVAQAGGGQVVVPTAATGTDQRPRALEAMLGGERADGVVAGGPVDIQGIEQVAGGQADVGLGMLGPPGQHPGPVGGGIVQPVGDQAAQGVLAELTAGWVAARASRRHVGSDQLPVAGDGLDAGPVGEWVVQREDGDATGGIAEGGVPEQPAGPAHRVPSVVGGRWPLRKLAALLRPQPAASASVRAVHGRPSAWPCR
jgi:hypothetical protein